MPDRDGLEGCVISASALLWSDLDRIKHDLTGSATPEWAGDV